MEVNKLRIKLRAYDFNVLDASVQEMKVDREGAYLAAVPHIGMVQEVCLHDFVRVF